MKSKYFLLSLAAAFAVAGCASTPSQQGDEKPPPKANRVQILMYDTTPRPKTTHLDVYDLSPPEEPYKVIAFLTCEGRVDQEAVMSTAIFYRARQIGADAVMPAGNVTTQKEVFSLDRYGVSGWGSTSSFSRWIMKPCGHGCIKNWIRPAALDLQTAATVADALSPKRNDSTGLCHSLRGRVVHPELVVAPGT